MVQVALHPSPETVLRSSHCAPMSRSSTPSPQNSIFLQAMPGVGQVYPGSTWQVDEQPSPLLVLPSSHCSVPPRMPSPQVLAATLVQGPPCPPTSGQVQPGSTIEQSALHPSPPTVL